MINIAETKMLPIDSIKFIDGNREIVESHVQKMYDLIEDNGFADTIKVAKKKDSYYAVEGQHRIVALKLHNVSTIPCSIVDWLDEDFEEIQGFIIDLNAHNRTWTLYDYVKSWADKKQLASQISNGDIDEMYNRAIQAGAIGGKISGAGGGGFLLLYCLRESQNKVREALKEFREFPFFMEKYGSKIIFNMGRYEWK